MSDSEIEIYTVSELNRLTRNVIESHFPLIWLEGELSNLARPASGHWYFTLKDEQAQVRCAMFRMKNRLLNTLPENGMQVLVRARVSFYEARGEFQLIVEQMEAAGDGLLRQRFLRLKQALEQRGWFDQAHKKPLPTFPKRVGIISSISGAALRDILSVVKRRFANLPLLVFPVTVQGEGAARTMIDAINRAQAGQYCDILILARGGGSLEDLWCFNDEKLAQTIFECDIPLVTGIGHEIDFTIADFVADCRAPTPSAAAELVTPERKLLANDVKQCYQRLYQLQRAQIEQKSRLLQATRQALRHPTQQIQFSFQSVDELEQRLRRQCSIKLERLGHQLKLLQQQLWANNPQSNIQLQQQQLTQIKQALRNNMRQRWQDAKQRLHALVRELEAVSPLATLSRGFAIVQKADSSDIIRDSSQLHQNELIRVQLKQGALLARVNEIEPEGKIRVEKA